MCMVRAISTLYLHVLVEFMYLYPSHILPRVNYMYMYMYMYIVHMYMYIHM